METISNIQLRDEKVYPDSHVLQTVLSDSYNAYLHLTELFDKHEMTFEWRYYHDGKAWLCKVQKKKRTIIWMSAWKGYIQASIYFPQKHIDKVYELNISETQKNKIRLTKDVGRLKPCIFEIRDQQIINDFEKVVHLKLECK